MKIFKTVDERLLELGFIKHSEFRQNCSYVRCDKEHNFTQVVSILHKRSGRHILLSYDPALLDDNSIGNTCVGLTYEEMKLFTKKFKQLIRRGWTDIPTVSNIRRLTAEEAQAEYGELNT